MLAIGIVVVCMLIGAALAGRDRLEGLWWGLVCGVVVALLVTSFAVEGATEHHFKYDKVEEVVHPVSMSDGLGAYGHVSGGLFFVSGFVESNVFYTWYEETSGGGYRSRSIHETEDSSVEVYEVPSTEEPRVEKLSGHDDCTAPHWIFFGACSGASAGTLWKVRVPEGTIVRQFKLDGASG